MVRIYKKKWFNIYKGDDHAYIVHNTRKDFDIGHTHINNFNTAKYVLNMALYNLIPSKHLSSYLLNSIIRVSNNESYANKIKALIK